MTPRPGNLFRQMLGVGDLRSDGLAPEVAAIVLAEPALLSDLVDILDDPDPSTRGHAADALERVARLLPERLVGDLDRLVVAAESDPVAMVRWHAAMILEHVTISPSRARRTVPGLIGRLDDPSAIVRAWAVSGLCLIARRFDGFDGDILPRLRRRERDQSIAVRHRAATAVGLLLDPLKPIPKSWVKGPAEATAPRRRRSRRA